MADNTTESMKDYEKELERSFRTINEGDIVSGSVIAVSEEEVILDLNYYTQGIIKVENLSNDEKGKYLISVATNDGLEQLTVMSQGALRMSAENLREEIARAGQ